MVEALLKLFERLLFSIFKMMDFLMFMLLGFRKNAHVYLYAKQSSLQSFGFDNNGKYSFNFTIPESFDDHFKLLLLDITTYWQQDRSFFGSFDLCSNKSILKQGITINRSIHSFSGIVKYKTILYPFILRCDSEDSTDDKINLLIHYQNPSTFLDLRIYPEIKAQLAISILFIAFFIAHLINWFLHSSFHIYLHQILTCSIISFLISHILRYCELISLNKSDNSHHLTQFHLIFVWISYFLITLFLLLMSHGLNIVTDVVPLSRFIIYLIVSIWLTFFPILYIFYDLGPNQKFILILITIGLIIFVTLMFINVRSSNSQIIKILIKAPLSISNDLAYLIHGIYKWFIFDVLIICFMITVFIIVYIACPIWNTWALELVISLIELFSLSLLSYRFRLRAKRINYRTVNGEIPLSNVETNCSVEQPLLKVPIE
ncbi:hypothetical protein M9Y10_021913 [Tritrichomonas musculus]|uniref:Intimal thickness related receptor IRP domain-containing protein n=1 Tax=Tritrichomonas musculus TaxID=1915356 RepID=A0ABR2KRP8_9EUKA